jgi:hypothetical protein
MSSDVVKIIQISLLPSPRWPGTEGQTAVLLENVFSFGEFRNCESEIA